MSNSNIWLYGSAEPLRQWIPLRAGPLTLHFDPENLSLRCFRLGEHEVLRAIYAAVRDRNWGTVLPAASNLQISAEADRFTIRFEARCSQGEIDFAWHGTLTGSPDGAVRFAFDGRARSEFWRSRIGLCALHPINECAGKPCSVEHTDGRWEDSVFPELISPRQPFCDVRAMRHSLPDRATVEVRFQGDVFETEDQRNWSDASFKTYSTPLSLPFPVRVEQGSRVIQEVQVTVANARSRATVTEPDVLVLAPAFQRPEPLPRIGLALPISRGPLSEREVARLRPLGLSHVRVELRLSGSRWREDLAVACSESRRLNAGLQLAVYSSAGAENEWSELACECARVRPPILLWAILDERRSTTSCRMLDAARAALSAYAPDAAFAAGTDAYFAEWNRNRPSPDSDALPCYSLNPQVHAFDLASLAENLDGQADTVRTARQAAGRPVVVGPITLRPRFNPNATAAESQVPSGQLPPQVDLRQLSLFGAGWTLGSIAALTSAGAVDALTYYEATGWLGIMETQAGSPMPDRFPSIRGAVFPMYHVFADLANCDQLCAVEGAELSQLPALGLIARSGQRRVLLANLEPRSKAVRLKWDLPDAQVRTMDADNVETAMRDPEAFRASRDVRSTTPGGYINLSLRPCAVVCVTTVNADPAHNRP